MQHIRRLTPASLVSRRVRSLVISALAIGSISGLSACSAVDVSNPTQVVHGDVENAAGADLAVEGARVQLQLSAGQAVVPTGLMTDEFFRRTASSDDHGYEASIDRRQREDYLAVIRSRGGGIYASWQELWVRSTVALSIVRRYAQPVKKGTQLGELFAFRGLAMVNLAEHICPGFPVRHLDASDLSNLKPDFSGVPLTTDSAFALAVAQFDSALVYADSARVLNLARVGKARALLGRGRFAEAAAVAQLVDPGFTTTIRSSYYEFVYGSIYASDHEGTNGIGFASAQDPRVPMTVAGDEYFHASIPTAYATTDFVPVVIASDVEARLIEAEAALALTPDAPTWLNMLNSLRGTVALPDTTDPGTPDARRNLLFRERALWLYGTAHRMGDLRRLIHQYGRDPEAVFPTGPFGEGGLAGTYSTATSLAFDEVLELVHNSAITGCTAD